MADLRMPKTQREQLMVILGFLGFAAAGLYWYYVFSPKSAALVTAVTAVEKTEKSNQMAKAQMASGTVNELREQAKTFADNLLLMRTLVPASNEVPTLLEQISTAARRVGLEVGNFEPMGPEVGQDFDAYRYKLSVVGGYHDVAQFLSNVGSLQRIVVPVNLQMNAMGSQNGPQKTVSTVFELHTYVAHTAPSSAKGGG